MDSMSWHGRLVIAKEVDKADLQVIWDLRVKREETVLLTTFLQPGALLVCWITIPINFQAYLVMVAGKFGGPIHKDKSRTIKF